MYASSAGGGAIAVAAQPAIAVKIPERTGTLKKKAANAAGKRKKRGGQAAPRKGGVA